MPGLRARARGAGGRGRLRTGAACAGAGRLLRGAAGARPRARAPSGAHSPARAMGGGRRRRRDGRGRDSGRIAARAGRGAGGSPGRAGRARAGYPGRLHRARGSGVCSVTRRRPRAQPLRPARAKWAGVSRRGRPTSRQRTWTKRQNTADESLRRDAPAAAPIAALPPLPRLGAPAPAAATRNAPAGFEDRAAAPEPKVLAETVEVQTAATAEGTRAESGPTPGRSARARRNASSRRGSGAFTRTTARS